jgi:hypothetical protein
VFTGDEFAGGISHGFVTLDARTGKLLASQWHPRRRSALIQHIIPSGAAALVAGDKIGPLGRAAAPERSLTTPRVASTRRTASRSSCQAARPTPRHEHFLIFTNEAAVRIAPPPGGRGLDGDSRRPPGLG